MIKLLHILLACFTMQIYVQNFLESIAKDSSFIVKIKQKQKSSLKTIYQFL